MKKRGGRGLLNVEAEDGVRCPPEATECGAEDVDGSSGTREIQILVLVLMLMLRLILMRILMLILILILMLMMLIRMLIQLQQMLSSRTDFFPVFSFLFERSIRDMVRFSNCKHGYGGSSSFFFFFFTNRPQNRP
jgi:hypothetical protein